jgi:hypothetical protein
MSQLNSIKNKFNPTSFDHVLTDFLPTIQNPITDSKPKPKPEQEQEQKQQDHKAKKDR